LRELISGITTRDVLAVLVVAAALLFNGISLITGKGPDASTMTLAGAVVGYYFKDTRADILGDHADEGPVAPPAIGDGTD
jgi:hypothetical protein